MSDRLGPLARLRQAEQARHQARLREALAAHEAARARLEACARTLAELTAAAALPVPATDVRALRLHEAWRQGQEAELSRARAHLWQARGAAQDCAARVVRARTALADAYRASEVVRRRRARHGVEAAQQRERREEEG